MHFFKKAYVVLLLFVNDAQSSKYSSNVLNMYIDNLEQRLEVFLLAVNFFFKSFSGTIRVTVNTKFPIWNSQSLNH